jgi:hypothetical protein
MSRMIVNVLAMSMLAVTAPLSSADEPAIPAGMKLIFEEDFEKGHNRWETTDDTNWQMHSHGQNKAFGIKQRQSDYSPKYRSPHTIALLKGIEVADFVVTMKVKSILDTGGHRDACVFFNYQDANNFYYVHLGAKPDPNSGQIMIVNNAPRRPLTNNKNNTGWDDQWHQVKIVRDTKTGTIEIYFDDMKKPHMKCVDKTFGKGRIGIGSFDDVNDFDDIRIYTNE